jgi:filamentous hemagglutinin family protein
MYSRSTIYLSCTVFSFWLSTTVVQAQSVIPDGSLNTIVNTSNDRNFVITGGDSAGPNLFHSFSEFSIPSGGSAVFDNATSIQNIFSRVTGSNVSNIDGLITANGSANLFLLNPNGVVFGPGASLNIGGSFLGTTAISIKFADGAEFGRANSRPLLMMSTPIGLQMGSNPAPIEVQGNGHRLTTASPLLAPYVPTGNQPGLAVRPGQTLALVGGDIRLTGGILTAPSGQVDLASLGSNASIAINDRLALEDAGVNRRNIQLSQKSLIDVNAINAGAIHLQGQQISLQDGSLVWVQNRGFQPSGNIAINATDRLVVTGVAPDYSSVSSIVNETLGGNAGNIDLTAAQLSITDGANIVSRAFGLGRGGDITIRANDLTISGSAPLSPSIFTTINSYTASPGAAGNLNINAQTISLLAGGVLGSTTSSSGNGGELNITADRVQISGFTPVFVASGISAPSVGGTGNAGNITLNTRTLALSEGGLLSVTSLGSGNAGRMTVNATESITIDGFNQTFETTYPSSIASAVVPPYEPYISLFNLTLPPTGSSGDLTIKTPILALYNGGLLTVQNDGSGMSGNINISADRIIAKDNSYIAASSKSGQGGNVRLTSNLLLLNQEGRVYTNSMGVGSGGNIDINSRLVVGANNSDISANSVMGAGGNIVITTQGILGLQYRYRLTPVNDITASSEFGVNGTVQVDSIGVDPNLGLMILPTDIVDPSQEIVTGCNDQKAGGFVMTGRGGSPDNPLYSVSSHRPWSDRRNVVNQQQSSPLVQLPIVAPQLVEATTWQRNQQRQTELVGASHPRIKRKTNLGNCIGSGVLPDR